MKRVEAHFDGPVSELLMSTGFQTQQAIQP